MVNQRDREGGRENLAMALALKAEKAVYFTSPHLKNSLSHGAFTKSAASCTEMVVSLWAMDDNM